MSYTQGYTQPNPTQPERGRAGLQNRLPDHPTWTPYVVGVRRGRVDGGPSAAVPHDEPGRVRAGYAGHGR